MNLPAGRPAVNSASALRNAATVYSEIFVTITLSGITSRKTEIFIVVSVTDLAEALSS
jgi:hypothetical protein